MTGVCIRCETELMKCEGNVARQAGQRRVATVAQPPRTRRGARATDHGRITLDAQTALNIITTPPNKL